MKFVLSFLTISIISNNASNLNNINKSDENNILIVNGEKVPVGEFPWYCGASNVDFSPTLCNGGGVLIASQWVLTAYHVAHTGTPPAHETFNFGIYNKKHPYKLETRLWSKVFYPKIPDKDYYFDVALVKLDKPVTGIKPVKIAKPSQRAKPGADVTVCGFGNNAEWEFTEDFMKANIKIQDPKLAEDPKYHLKDFKPFNGDYDFIAGTLSGLPKSTALCDSGGPLLQKINGEWVVQGVTSRGPGYKKGQTWALGIYAGISHFYDWINETIANN